ACIQEGSDQAAATHHEDVLAFLSSQPLGKLLDWLFDEFKTGQDFPRRAPREDVVIGLVLTLRDALATLDELQHKVVGLTSQQNGVNRFPELAHAVIPLWARTIEPIDAAVLARDKAIGAGGDVDDYFSHCHCDLR